MQCPSCQARVDESERYCPSCGTALAPPATGAAGSHGAAQAAQAEGPSLAIGQLLGGKYRVVRLLGEGGMGAVYEGEQQLGTTKRKIAIKTLHPSLSRDAKIKARFEREVGTVAELEHPNTIQVFDFGSTEDGILYIVMEFLHGKSLAVLLERDGAMPPDRVDRIIQQVCGSLEEAHARGIVHRDLKPDNVVLVDRAGKKDFVKVLDFGIAKRAHEEDRNEQKLTQQGMVLGTPPYMSPEQFTGRPIDARSDIYSLGVMAYEMLTGRLPFQANTAWEWATQHMTQAPIPIESLAGGTRAPEAMRATIRRSLAKSPDERFQTVQEFAAAFSGAAAPATASPSASATQAAAARQKTEVGAPLDVAAAFGAAPAPAPAPAPAATPGYTPMGGNVAFPTPAAIPQAPPRESPASNGRALLLGAAGVIAVVSIGAIVFSLRGGSGGSRSTESVGLGTTGAAPPATSLAPATAPSDTVATQADSASGSDVPPLSGGAAPHPAPHAPPHVAPGTSPAPTSPNPPSLPTMPAPPPPAPRPAKYDGPECERARRLRALGHPREAESWALACTAKGGTP
ncbi:MAG TPA: serine/threonine-protein kinase [Polyangiaceae bacterium]|nr:serine/threonine-protein kinase [Polyangiaceae bacterium]